MGEGRRRWSERGEDFVQAHKIFAILTSLLALWQFDICTSFGIVSVHNILALSSAEQSAWGKRPDTF